MPPLLAPQAYVERALAIIEPPAEQREAVRTKVALYIEALPRIAPILRQETRGVPTKQLRSYVKRLAATRRARAALPWRMRIQELALDAEIDRVQSQLLCSRRGHRPRDLIAHAAVIASAECLTPERCTLTYGGPWHILTMLFYEAATRQAHRDHVLNYMWQMRGVILGRGRPILGLGVAHTHALMLRRPLVD